MPVSTPNQEYRDRAPAWRLMRDCMSGQRAIHLRGVKYLPLLDGEKPAAYAARLARSCWYNATWRSVEGFVGMLFRKEPKVEISAGTLKHLADVTKKGQPFSLFAKEVGLELEGLGLSGVLVDYPLMVQRTGGRAPTVAEVEAANMRPHMAIYPAETIINHRFEWINNKTQLSLVVLKEIVQRPKADDEFCFEAVVQYRVLDLSDGGVEGGGPRYYRQRLFNEREELIPDSEVWPTMANQRMREITFEFFGDGVPPLEDLAHLNVSHYQTSSDLEHGAHKTALPTVVISGYEPKIDQTTGQVAPGQEITIGGDAILLPQGAEADMLEYTGQGLTALEKRAEVKERQMAVIASRMIEQQKSGVESAEAAGIHRAGEQSTLQSHADILGLGLARCLRWFDQWCGGAGGDAVTCSINKDFMPNGLTAQEMVALLQAWQAGAMSYQEYFNNMQQGGRMSDGTDVETEKARIETAPPTLPAAPTAPAGGGQGDE